MNYTIKINMDNMAEGTMEAEVRFILRDLLERALLNKRIVDSNGQPVGKAGIFHGE